MSVWVISLTQALVCHVSAHTIGYLRVSTSHQDTTKNQADILVLAYQHALGQVRFIEEKVSGKTRL
jgi:DNA invertase Pin-like site-specific DNA recombinase